MTTCTRLRKFAAAVLIALITSEPVRADWTGLYVGSSVGWVGQDLDWSWDIYMGIPPRETRQRADNLAGGLHLGGRRQWGQVVVGLEGSLHLFHGAVYSTEANAFQPGVPKDFGSRIGWLGTLTPRLGWDLGNSLAYIKGGYAISRVALATYVSPQGEIQTISNGYLHGWTVGGGLEWRLHRNVSLGIEYDFVRLTGQSRSGVEVGQTVESANHLGDVDIHQVMLRLNLLIPY